MKQRVRIHKAAEAVATEAGDVVVVAPQNRLTGISVNEVSIVDRAANQRKYLVVKDFPPHPAPPAAAPAAPPAAPAAPAGTPMAISPELKVKLATVLKTAMDQLTAISAAVAGATDTPGAPAPAPLVAALAALGGLFTSAVVPTTPAAAPAPPPPPGAVGKAGRKISASRLAQLLSAKTALDSILAEVAGNEEPSEEEKPEKTEAKKEDAASEVPPAASPELTEIKASLDSLAAVVGKMTTVFAGQNQRIDALSKARGESRQVDIDKAAPKPKRVVWDMDMATPTKSVQ